MKNRTFVFLFLLCVFAMTGVASPLGDTDAVRKELAERLQRRPCGNADRAIAMARTPEEREALEFLYAYMSWPDMTDYAPEFYLRQVKSSLRARRELPWGTSVPEREWRHFVLPVRVNNEHLDSFRTVCYEQLRQRVAGLSMYDAVLEVNHWCHQYVTYRPSDARTSSPLATMRTATGRCGEESTFTVAALRAVGIPARQVYTPRWAHTDDNHAWVEAWADGRWYFLGACEPEPALDLGWFNRPASRGMLMHTRVFGRYDGPEDVISRTPCYTEINVTANYAPVARTTVRVVDGKGNPVADALLDFKLYNYAELFTVHRTRTDASGQASITSGLGDLVAWAAKGGRYGFAKFTAGSSGEVRVELSHGPGERFGTDLDIVPPAGHDNVPDVGPEAIRTNERRKAQEDSIRIAYTRTFPQQAEADSFSLRNGYDPVAVWQLVQKCCGNYRNLFRILSDFRSTCAISVLQAMTDKDLRDFDYDVLADHFRKAGLPPSCTPFTARYVYSPRISVEALTPWRSCLDKAFTDEEKTQFRTRPAALAAWVGQHVETDGTWNPLGFLQSPESVVRYRTADARSRELLFVAAARTLGIPARIDEVTGKVQYASFSGVAPADEETVNWIQADLNSAAVSVSGAASAYPCLKLSYTPREFMKNPAYYTHFTVSRLYDGLPFLQAYSEGSVLNGGFVDGKPVEEGDYLLVSGTRMADGSVLARLEVFPMEAGKDSSVTLLMREDKTNIQVIGSFNAENQYADSVGAACRTLLSATGRGYYAVGLIRAGHEPSNHILHDLERMRSELEAWGRPILLLFPTEEEAKRFERQRGEFPSLPSTVRFGIDSRGEVAADLFSSGLTASHELPVVFVGDTFNRVVFFSQGYTIGMGDQISRVVGKLR